MHFAARDIATCLRHVLVHLSCSEEGDDVIGVCAADKIMQIPLCNCHLGMAILTQHMVCMTEPSKMTRLLILRRCKLRLWHAHVS